MGNSVDDVDDDVDSAGNGVESNETEDDAESEEIIEPVEVLSEDNLEAVVGSEDNVDVDVEVIKSDDGKSDEIDDVDELSKVDNVESDDGDVDECDPIRLWGIESDEVDDVGVVDELSKVDNVESDDGDDGDVDECDPIRLWGMDGVSGAALSRAFSLLDCVTSSEFDGKDDESAERVSDNSPSLPINDTSGLEEPCKASLIPPNNA
ncbi:unnamed protein product [Calypogeia fissa]